MYKPNEGHPWRDIGRTNFQPAGLPGSEGPSPSSALWFAQGTGGVLQAMKNAKAYNAKLRSHNVSNVDICRKPDLNISASVDKLA